MKRHSSLLQSAGTLFLLLAAACGGPITTVTPEIKPAMTEPAQVTSAAPSGTQPTATPVAGPAAATAAPSGAKPGGGPVALQVQAPQDGAVVNAPEVQVSGTASPGAVVTVNDAILVVGADGTFTSSVTLDQGPNLIEVIASSSSGDTQTVDLTVSYQP